MTPYWCHVLLKYQLPATESLLRIIASTPTVTEEAQALAEKIRQDLIALQSALAVYIKPKN